MKELYTKVLLYAYPCVDKLIEQIDELVEKKAYSSMDDFSPCIEISNKILNLTEQKKRIIQIYYIVSDVLSKLSNYEKDCLEYKYFKRLDKEHFKDFDSTSRTYFRNQIKCLKRVGILLEKFNYSDERFLSDKNCVKFLSDLCKRVEEMENKDKKMQNNA